MISVYKIGGNVVDNPIKLDSFLADFSTVKGQKILVHGGGKIATKISAALGIETTMINGRRVTDAETLNVVTMVYAGGVNKDIVARLQAKGCNAIGLSGADGALIKSVKRNPIPVDYGFVGDPECVNTALLQLLTNEGYTVVAAPITLNTQGGVLNTNADTIASTIATALATVGEQTQLTFCFEKKGVLANVDDDNSVIHNITAADFERLKADGTISAGMLPKLENAFKAIESGVNRVVICSANDIANTTQGTTLVK